MTKPAALDRSPLTTPVQGLVLAGFLAALAGMVDVIAYLHLGGLFVAFMSGNSTQLGAALGQADLAEAGIIFKLVVLFVAGAAGGQVLAGLAGRFHLAIVLIAVTLLLVLAAVLATAPEPIVLAMGALNASLRRAGNIPVSLTFVTGVLVRFGQGSRRFLDRACEGIELAVAGHTLGRTDCRSDDRQRCLCSSRRGGDLASDLAGRPSRRLLGGATGIRLIDALAS
jgi:Protein of unknown function (DUF1275)